MLRKIIIFGTIAGLIVGLPLFSLTVMNSGAPHPHGVLGMAIGYLTMLIALSTVFIAIKGYRDQTLGGVIKFWPAFGMGLAISFLASLFYVMAWEAALSVTQMDFAGDYAKSVIAAQTSKGLSAHELDVLKVQMEAFKSQYANPLYRIPMTFTEIFPIGILVSLVSAALLRQHRFMPARKV